ncbi:Type IV pilus biogenesis protein PilQ [Lysobacter dokdonensis DS-58]|uniref:Type IV pilus biogenesis protein PilQ n=1 Tax=Lysobacter dokdonensis DS-58 TaxID=1300345 RepID=A0A0A2WP90_9GAMM|nr:Type IV pilus biogenesis protein PilQ [Lysobacter dokdonensis DS-58]
MTAFGAADAAQASRVLAAQSAAANTATAPTPSLDPSKNLPGTISVSNIDFKRGDGGSGRLSLRFNGAGAIPDMRNEGSRVIIDVGNAKLPASLSKPLNVADFATPVQRIDARADGAGTKLVLATNGNFESMAYQSGNEYVVEIVPRAAAAKPAPGANVGATASNTPVRAYGGRPVTFNFQDVPVRTVLQLIAEESNLNIVASDTVSGNVTLRLINVPWDQALDIVLRAKGLDKRRDGNVVWVAPQDEIAKYEQAKEDARIAIENRAEMITEYVPINYGNAEDIAKLLTEESKSSSGGGGAGATNQRGFLSPRGSISFDRRTNTLLVIDIPSKVSEIRRLVSLLDKPVDQVLIEARIVIATESFARELGAKFGIAGGNNNVLFNGSVAGNTANSVTPRPNPPPNKTLNVNLPVVDAAGALALSIINAGYVLDVELSALQEEGRGEVISNPRIVTSNQKEAVIRQGQEVGYVTISQQQGAGAAAIPNVQFKDVLLELKVTPTITNDGRVFLNMAVKKDEIEGFVQSGIGDVPQINKREVNTAVLVDNGQTVVIGGVYEFRDRADVTKVPWLGDLPVIGNLFKKKGRTKEKAELLIFVTPKVMQVAQRG